MRAPIVALAPTLPSVPPRLTTPRRYALDSLQQFEVPLTKREFL
jgi:hypothetical protein